jgi:hypothetical protein
MMTNPYLCVENDGALKGNATYIALTTKATTTPTIMKTGIRKPTGAIDAAKLKVRRVIRVTTSSLNMVDSVYWLIR